MTAGIITAVALIILILAVYAKDPILKATLWSIGFIAWFIFTGAIYSAVWIGNTYLATAAGFLGLSMVILCAVNLLAPLFWRDRGRRQTYDEKKKVSQKRIYDLTKKKEPPEDDWRII